MRKRLKEIQVPDGLISNQYSNGVNVSPKTTYLYVWLKILLTDFKTNTLYIQPIQLRKHLEWKTNDMLKNHMKVLKDMGYITYQVEFDNNQLKANQMLEINIAKITTRFKTITEKSIIEKIFQLETDKEKAVRYCYLIKCYTNKNYGYCWLTYEQIVNWGNIRKNDIDSLNNMLMKDKLLFVTRGKVIRDNADRIRKENNKYQLLFN